MRASGWPLRIGILVLVGVGIFLGASIPQGPPERSGRDLAGLRGSIVLYEDPGIEPGTSTNLSLTEVGTGRNASLSNDLRAQIRQGTVLRKGTRDQGRALGYLALVEDGTRTGQAPYDIVLVRFSDMVRIVLDRGVAGMKGAAVGEGGELSYLVRNAKGDEIRRRVDLASAQPAPGTRIVEARLVPKVSSDRDASGPAMQ